MYEQVWTTSGDMTLITPEVVTVKLPSSWPGLVARVPGSYAVASCVHLNLVWSFWFTFEIFLLVREGGRYSISFFLLLSISYLVQKYPECIRCALNEIWHSSISFMGMTDMYPMSYPTWAWPSLAPLLYLISPDDLIASPGASLCSTGSGVCLCCKVYLVIKLLFWHLIMATPEISTSVHILTPPLYFQGKVGWCGRLQCRYTSPLR